MYVNSERKRLHGIKTTKVPLQTPFKRNNESYSGKKREDYNVCPRTVKTDVQ